MVNCRLSIFSFFFTLLFFSVMHSFAQQHAILSERIKTLRVSAGPDPAALPVIHLGTEQQVDISFDDLTHEYQRYTYSIQHCEADWTPSDALFTSDYIDGFSSDHVIEDCELSSATAVAYTHYRLQIPNDECRITMSGNYLLTITDDSSQTPVATVAFMVCEPKFSAAMSITGNTDIDINGSHQQADLSIRYNGVSVTQPERQVKTVVMQNSRWSTARWLDNPQISTSAGQSYAHCRQLIFPATNEYRKFEYLDIHRSSMGVEETYYDGEHYHAALYTDMPRPNYVYDRDANGAFVIRNTYDRENDTQSEYFLCHFTYRTPEPFPGDVYLNGQWTYDSTDGQYRMTYDSSSQAYRCTVMLKMGYYSYQYLLAAPDGSLSYLPAEGNYYETENMYTCLVYYRPIGGRTDLLYAAYSTYSR